MQPYQTYKWESVHDGRQYAWASQLPEMPTPDQLPMTHSSATKAAAT